VSGGSIGDLLDQWPFDPEGEAMRLVVDHDGRERLQIRLDLGILQLELDGRPDGAEPHGYPSLLDYHLQRLDDHCRRHGGPEGYRLEADDCEQLRTEAAQFYQRYFALFQLDRYDGVVRDTARNLRCLDFVHQYAANQDDRMELEQYRPYILMINALARLELHLVAGDLDGALNAVDVAIAGTVDFVAQYSGRFSADRELEILRQRRAELAEVQPASETERLTQQLEDAIGREDYEAAARLRDQLQQRLDEELPPIW